MTCSPIFDKLKKVYPGKAFAELFQTKIKAVEGDVSAENLGLSPGDLSKLINEVNIVIHCAATVDFNERLDIAVDMNCLGTLRVLEVGKRVKHLDCFLHVSTAYTNSNRRNCRIEEKVTHLDM